MTTISADHNGTTGTVAVVIPATPGARRRADAPTSEVPGWAQLVAALVAAGFGIVAVVAGAWPVLAIPCYVAAFATLAGIFLPDVIGRRYDRQRAAQEAEEVGA